MGELIVGLIVLWVLISWFQKGSKERELKKQVEKAAQKAIEETRKGLTIKITDEVFGPEGGKIDVIRVTASGTVIAPYDGYQAVTRVAMADVTDGEEAPLPVLSVIPDLANENGVASRQEKETIPYMVTSLEDYPVFVIPRKALILPKRGLRQIMVIVQITSADNPDQALTGGTGKFQHKYEAIGYTEMEQAQQEQEELIAVLALTVAAADGQMDKVEKGVIRRFFTEHFAGKESEAETTEHVNDAMRRTFQMVERDAKRARILAVETAKKMRKFDIANYSFRAYELCVQVAVADEVMEVREREILREIAEELGLRDEDVESMHDQYISYKMVHEDNILVEMPPELKTKEQQCEWINKEYARWRTRMDHSDSNKAAEAVLRVERLVHLRIHLKCSDVN